LRFPLREALRPLDELRLLLSLGAWVEESLSTRLDSVRAPDLLCVCDREEERLDPDDDRLRELPERLDEDDRVFDFELFDFDEEPWEPPERLLLLRDREAR
jgi:hypothetical protein